MKHFTKVVAVMAIVFFLGGEAMAQHFISPSFAFSGKKISYITLKNGQEIQGHLRHYKIKKGLIKEVKLKLESGEKVSYKAAAIDHMYLRPSGLEKVLKVDDYLSDVTQWGNTDLESDILQKGYVYLEQTTAQIKKHKQVTVLMELLNPTFCGKLKVYNDPYAKETMSVGVGGMTMAGGDAKSYWVLHKGDKVATRLKKKHFDDEYKQLFEGCPSLIEQVSEKTKWSHFEEDVYKYDQCK